MWFRLALALGGRTVAELKDNMSYQEFLHWCAYMSIEPIGDARVDQSAALLGSILLQGQMKPDQLIPDYWTQTIVPQNNKSSMLNQFKALTSGLSHEGVINE